MCDASNSSVLSLIATATGKKNNSQTEQNLFAALVGITGACDMRRVFPSLDKALSSARAVWCSH